MWIEYDQDAFRGRIAARRPRYLVAAVIGLVLVGFGFVTAMQVGAGSMPPWVFFLTVPSFLLGWPITLESFRTLSQLPRVMARSLDFFDDPGKPLVVTLAASPQAPVGTRIPVAFRFRLAAFALSAVMLLSSATFLGFQAHPVEVDPDVTPYMLPVAVFAALSALTAWSGLRTVRAAPNAAVTDGRFAFVVDGEMLRFPSGQRWRLDQATLSDVDVPNGGGLRIMVDGASKWFPASRLQLPPAIVVGLVEARRTGKPASHHP